MRMRRLSLLLCLPLLCLLGLGAFGPPIKGADRLALGLAGGDTVTATWVYKAPGLFATDTALLTWSVKATGATAWTTVGVVQKTRITSATKPIPQTAVGDSVRLCIVVARVGAPFSPNVC